MAGSGALLACIRHQAGALFILWAAAAPQLPHSPHSLPTRKPPAPAGLAQLGTDQERRERCPSMVGLRGWKEREKLWGKTPRKEKRVETYLSALVSPGQAGWPSQGWRDVRRFKRWLCAARCPY